jgi:carboxypeptidase Taq
MAADAADAYDQLLDRVERLGALADARGVLHWDQQVTMPEGGTPARAAQSSALSTLTHQELVADETGDLLDRLADADLDADQAAVVRETRRRYDREVSVPGDLVSELTREQSEAQEVWQRAKADADWSAFAPKLETIVDLDAERAEHIDPDRDPYEVLYEDNMPHLPLDRVERIFDRLRDELPPLIDDIRASDADLADPFTGEFDEDAQRDLNEAALDLLGYDFERGRLDTSPHPFTVGSQFDCRVTTRFHEDDPLDALTATIHEFGHATYQLGLPDEHYGTPLGQSLSSGVHESQSRFWENHVGRTEAFWEFFLPTMKEHFPGKLDGVTPRDAYEAVNQVYPDNVIRVEADEVTYHMHVILRTEIERAVMDGDLAIDDVPAAWNDTMEAYLGVRPDDDADGCLQDIHWTRGFASFHGYTVGSVLAAQLHAAMEADLGDIDPLVRDGDFQPIHDWLTEHVHQHGQRLPTPELVEHATGEPLTADYYLDYAKDKFGELYTLH